MMKAVCLISGEGTNLEAILKHIDKEKVNLSITSVISDNPKALGLKIAKKFNIDTHAFNFEKYKDIRIFDDQLEVYVENINPDIVILAGYMRILSKSFCSLYSGKIINIHPSLLPKLKGLNTYQRALSNNELYHGSSVHLVVNEIDSGSVIIQFRTKIKSSDTVSSLRRRIMEGEYIIYPMVISYLANENLKIINEEPYLFGKKLINPIVIDDF